MSGHLSLAHLYRRLVYSVGGLCLLAGMAACTSAAVATPTPVTIELAGSTAATPVLQDLAAAFNHRHPHVVFALRGGGSTLGEEWVRAGDLDLAASTLLPPEMRQPQSGQPSELDSPTAAPPSAVVSAPTSASTTEADAALMRIPIAVDGLAIVVHPSNPVSSLTSAQLRDLYNGEILNWRTLGGIDAEVLLVSRENGSGARVLFEERIMGGAAVSLTAIVMPTHADVAAHVADHPNAIGYVSQAFVADAQNGDARDVAPSGAISATGALTGSARAALGRTTRLTHPVRIVAVAGILPTSQNLLEQQYVLVHPLYLVSRGQPKGWMAQFIDFVLSPAGQEIVSRYHAPVR